MVSFHFFSFVTSTNQVAPASLIFNEHISRSQLWKPLHSPVFQQTFSINPFCSFLQLFLSFVTCTSILAPAYALSHERILISQIQKPLLQACYSHSWCWSLAQSRSWSLHGSLQCLAESGCRQRQLRAYPPTWPAPAWCTCQPPFWSQQLHQHWPGS